MGYKPAAFKQLLKNLGQQVQTAPLPFEGTWYDGRCFRLTYVGEVSSLNESNGREHWSKRHRETNRLKGLFAGLLLEARVQRMDGFRLVVEYNSHLDVDNTILLCKSLVDAMKGSYIRDDDKTCYRGLSITPNESLPHNTYRFSIEELIFISKI